MAGIFEVDEAKCVKCGACVRDCAFQALTTNTNGYPHIFFLRKFYPVLDGDLV